MDGLRKIVTISAQQLLRELYDNWDKLPAAVRSYFTKRVAIVGTESCGKTTIATKLAKFFNTNQVHEIGRVYCEQYANLLTVPMFDSIAMEHMLLQDKMAEGSNKVLFVDSDAVITPFYLSMYFPRNDSCLIDEIAQRQQYDLMLYLEPDVVWVSDRYRFAGENQQQTSNNTKAHVCTARHVVTYDLW